MKVQLLKDIVDGKLKEFNISYRIHAVHRMFQRGISEKDIEHLLLNGKIAERYEDDFPLPSFLICGFTEMKRPPACGSSR